MEDTMPNANDAPANQGQDGANKGAAGKNTDPDQPTFVTEETVTQIVNSAVTSQLGRALKKELAPAIAAALEPLKADIAKAHAPPPADDGKAKDASKVSPEVTALQKELADMKAALKAKDEEAALERQKARDKESFGQLVTELTGKVKPGTERMVATWLAKGEGLGRFIVAEDGTTTLKVRTKLSATQPEQDHEFPLATGIGHYLKTQEAAHFLPAPNGGAGGSGGSPPKREGGQTLNGGRLPTGATPVDAFEAQHGSIDDHL